MDGASMHGKARGSHLPIFGMNEGASLPLDIYSLTPNNARTIFPLARKKDTNIP